MTIKLFVTPRSVSIPKLSRYGAAKLIVAPSHNFLPLQFEYNVLSALLDGRVTSV